MKKQAKLLTIVFLTVSLVSACQKNHMTAVSPAIGDTSANSLDWEGEYSGVVPCASCEGIATSIHLSGDGDYTMTIQYLGEESKPITYNGIFTWNDAGNIIALSGLEGMANKYLVGENRLFQLDLKGNRITGELADHYILEKKDMSQENPLTGKKWVLVEIRGKELTPKSDFPIYIQLEESEPRVTGFGGCNGFFGEYLIKEGLRVSFDKLGRTQKYCQESMAIENEFFEALELVDNYSSDGETLSLNRARMAPLLRFRLEGN